MKIQKEYRQACSVCRLVCKTLQPGDRVASSAVAYGQKAELASVKIGVQNATEALQALEMANNAISKMSEMVVRLEELNALGAMGLIVPTTKLQLS